MQKVYSSEEGLQRVASAGSLRTISQVGNSRDSSNKSISKKKVVYQRFKDDGVSEEELVKKKRLEFDFGFQYPNTKFKDQFLAESAKYREYRKKLKQ